MLPYHVLLLTLCPAENLIEAYQADYQTMREQMIYGDSLDPSELFKKVAQLIAYSETKPNTMA